MLNDLENTCSGVPAHPSGCPSVPSACVASLPRLGVHSPRHGRDAERPWPPEGTSHERNCFKGSPETVRGPPGRHARFLRVRMHARSSASYTLVLLQVEVDLLSSVSSVAVPRVLCPVLEFVDGAWRSLFGTVPGALHLHALRLETHVHHHRFGVPTPSLFEYTEDFRPLIPGEEPPQESKIVKNKDGTQLFCMPALQLCAACVVLPLRIGALAAHGGETGGGRDTAANLRTCVKPCPSS